ncbi:hypothetical protein MSAN_00087700 [Mycena sanguinolenta]|uniref:Uncharacterized protein n=1 Tax=Mycena sanguinolenta TaxID=230812 RepID=A0A8H7DKG6_9AGAR|nr:hypothetical protein MSAN_00087700 [Mycena sanguinolenta]
MWCPNWTMMRKLAVGHGNEIDAAFEHIQMPMLALPVIPPYYTPPISHSSSCTGPLRSNFIEKYTLPDRQISRALHLGTSTALRTFPAVDEVDDLSPQQNRDLHAGRRDEEHHLELDEYSSCGCGSDCETRGEITRLGTPVHPGALSTARYAAPAPSGASVSRSARRNQQLRRLQG